MYNEKVENIMEQINVKINKYFVDKGIITVPNSFALNILNIDSLNESKTFLIKLKWKRNFYDVNLRHVYKEGVYDYWHLDWRNSKELCLSLKKEFIQTYIKIRSSELDIEQNNCYGSSEAITIKYVEPKVIQFLPFIKSSTPYDPLFKKLVDTNAFYFMDKLDKKSLISKSTNWISISKLKDEPNQDFVIYYLMDTVNKKLYIGSAKKLKDRVVPGRSEIPNWNYFRYEIVNPEFSSLLRSIEYHSIANFARFLDNNANIGILDIGFSEYKLVNKDCNGIWLDK